MLLTSGIETVNQTRHPICNMMVLQGPCKKYEMNYAYDDNTGQCRLFLYGGCLGSKNRFPTLKDCQKKCGL
ncbi:hypothetical protein CDAR_466171 [Caerostris darwini]|uniref:BPTI/Kunitz inhibitor domain-containing protein n=1 Tax=Caerostris darwini TaxID=1538125 RepID=A0AAV4Q4S7_9ARAC|nr:hypothetical protein CDAR_466171 [Caerostris darwini]